MTKPSPRSMLLFADFVASTTGFARVAREIAQLFNRKGWEVDQLAINAMYNESANIPYLRYWRGIESPHLKNSGDVYGLQSGVLIHALNGLSGSSGGFKKHYDVLFFLQDLFVFQAYASDIRRVKEAQKKAGFEPMKVVYYCPIDGHFMPEWLSNMDVVDVLIPFSEYGKTQALDDCSRFLAMCGQNLEFVSKRPDQEDPRIKERTAAIYNDMEQLKKAYEKFENCKPVYHGTNTSQFFPLSDSKSSEARAALFGKNAGKFIVGCINRNQPRKDISRLIDIFAGFKKQVPNSYLYMHMSGSDFAGIEIAAFANRLGLIRGLDYDTRDSLPLDNGMVIDNEFINKIYNSIDVHISTTKGEGWGLTTTESMAAGCLTVLPDNSTAREILGDNERGLVYALSNEIAEATRGDFSRVRYRADLNDGIRVLMDAYNMSDEDFQRITSNAISWVKSHSWEKKVKEMAELIERV